LFLHARVDVGSPFGKLIYAPDTRRLLGLTYVEDLWRVHYFDAQLARMQAEADTAFPDSAIVRVTSSSDDRTHAIFYTEGPKDPGSFYLVDRKKGSSELIGRVHPALPACELGDVAIIKYPARDGTKITGYLTLPPGRGEKNLPMVVMPHGGPELRDSDEMLAWSPAKNADKFAALVLLIHGEWDRVVPYEQSLFMERALNGAGKPVELVRVRKDRHQFEKPASQSLLFTEIQKFLAQHLGH